MAYRLLTPIMTSNDTPSGVVSCSSYYSFYAPWLAFDQSTAERDGWHSDNIAPHWIQYEFGAPQNVTKLGIQNFVDSGTHQAPRIIDFQASNDGTNYTTLATLNVSSTESGAKQEWAINNSDSYYYYRLYIRESEGDFVAFGNIYLYGGHADIRDGADTKAVSDWFRSTRYLKEEIDEFFVLKNTYTPYELTLIATEGDEVRLTGQTSLRSYTFKMLGDEITKLMFFTSGETIVATNGLTTISMTLTDKTFEISFAKSITLVDSYADKGTHQYTIQEDGMYLIILSTGAGYVTSNANITLPQGRTAIVEDLMNYELNNQYQQQVRYSIANLQAGDVVNTEIIRNDGSWNTNLNDIYKLSNIPINSNSSIIKHLERVGDGTASYTPPNDDNYYLEIGVAYATYGNKHNYTDLTGKDPEVVLEEETGYKSLIAFYYGKGNKLPTISMQGYDGGAGVVGCIQI